MKNYARIYVKYLLKSLAALAILIGLIIGVMLLSESWIMNPASTCSTIDLNLPEPSYVRTKIVPDIAYDTKGIYHNIHFDKPLPDDIIQTLEERCSDPHNKHWEKGRYDGLYNPDYIYSNSYDCCIITSDFISMRYVIREAFYTTPIGTSVFLFIIWLITFLLWGSIIAVSWIVRVLFHRRRKESRERASSTAEKKKGKEVP